MAVPNVETWTKQGSTTASATLTLTKPSGVQVGDLLLLICINDDTGDDPEFTTEPTGWNLAGEGGNSSAATHIAVFWRIADGTEGSTIQVTANSSDEWMGFYVRISGAHDTTPLNTSAFSQSSSSSSSHAVGEVTTDTDDCLVLYGLSFDGGDGYPFTISGTGWAEIDEYQTGTTGYSDVSGCFGSRNLSSKGVSGIVTVTCSASDGAAYFQLAIAPAAAPPPTKVTQYLAGNDSPVFPHEMDLQSDKLPCPPPY